MFQHILLSNSKALFVDTTSEIILTIKFLLCRSVEASESKKKEACWREKCRRINQTKPLLSLPYVNVRLVKEPEII